MIIIVFFSQLSCSLLEEANKALEKNDIQKALKLYNQSAINGDDEAVFILGKLHYNGQYIPRDIQKALEYFEKIAAYGHEKAAYNSAIIYASKNYKYHDYKKAYHIFLELAKNRHAKAQNQVGVFLLHGLGVEKDYKLAVKWFEQSFFENGYEQASCNLAVMFANGYGVFPNFGRARKLAQSGYEKGFPLCVKVYKEFNLHKYPEDKGFKFGYYR